MNYEEVNSVKELAPKVVGVLKRLEWIEYLKKQKGGIVKKWSWIPQMGEWCVWKGNIEHIVDVDTLSNGNFTLYFDYISDLDCYFDFDNRRTLASKVISILSWETIEKVLERAGYYFEEPIKRVYGSEGSKCHCVIKKEGNPKPIGIAWGYSRQQVVMLAIIELGKELNK